jgi:Helix-turn-helix domain
VKRDTKPRQRSMPKRATVDHFNLPDDSDVLLDEKQTARCIKNSPSTLQKWRVRGVGPAFLKINGAVRYRVGDLKDWLASKRRISTADIGGGAVGDAPYSMAARSRD